MGKVLYYNFNFKNWVKTKTDIYEEFKWEKKSIFDFEMEDIRLEEYEALAAIKAPVAV